MPEADVRTDLSNEAGLQRMWVGFGDCGCHDIHMSRVAGGQVSRRLLLGMQKEQSRAEPQMGAGKRKLMKENQKLKERLKAAEVAKDEAPDKKKVKPEVKKMPIKMPKGLWGLQPMKGKESICYAGNMGSCQGGDSCDKGLHICMKCWKKDHGASKCPK